MRYRPGRGYNLGGQIRVSTSRRGNLGGQIGPPTSRKDNLGGQIGVSTSWKGNLGGQIGPPTSRTSNLEGRIRLFTCFTPKIFTHYLTVEGIGTPIFFENEINDLLDGLSKRARFETRAGRKWEQEHIFEVLEAWK